jgi:5-methyltetrahydropteroyltriglutamate--homocysteine methyltransferase
MAFTATKDVPLAATTTGSWPRPAWYTQSLWGRPLDTAMLDPIYREQFSDALAVVVSDQERAGLDIVTNGDYFLDADLAGRSWHHYPLQRWRGVAFDELQPEGTRSDLLKYPPGTLLNEIYTSWRWPIVTGKIQHNPRNPLEYAKIYRMTQARSRKPVKFGTVSGQVMALFLDSHTPEYRIEDNKKQMIWDMATAINRELRELVASGCTVIQIEEPTIHFIACYYPDATETLNFLTDAMNHELSGLEKAEIWVHTCWGNPMMQRVFDRTSYANALEIYLDRVNCDVLTLEMKDRGMAELELLGNWKGKTKKKFALGVVSHRTLNADTPVEVANEIRKALKHVNLENLVVTSDCGYGRQGATVPTAL